MNPTRRNFLKNAVIAIGAGAVLPSFLRGTAYAEEKRRSKPGAGGDSDLPLVTPGTGMALSLNYVHNNKDIKDAKFKTERQGVKFEDQKCANCMLYTANGKKNGEDVGKCQLFANQVVKSTGWCNSWAKKA